MIEKLYNISKGISEEISQYGLTPREEALIFTWLIIQGYVRTNDEAMVLASINTMLENLGMEMA